MRNSFSAGSHKEDSILVNGCHLRTLQSEAGEALVQASLIYMVGPVSETEFHSVSVYN